MADRVAVSLLLALGLLADGIMEACGPVGFIQVSAITITAAAVLHIIAGAKKKAPCIHADQSQMQETR